MAGEPIDRVVGYDEELDDIEDQRCSLVGWPELGVSPVLGFCMDEGKFNQEKMNLFLLCWLNLRPNKEERKRHFNVVGII